MQWHEFRSHIRLLPARDLRRIEEAFHLAQMVHKDQKRKSGEPYFQHPIAVAHMLLDMGGDTDTIIASLLHDAVEDTPLTLAEIEQQFGKTVATLIDGVTKLDVRAMTGNPQLSEQVESLRKMFTLMQEDVRIIVIKLVDRLHNMQTVEFLPPEKQLLLARETLDTYVKIADKLCMQDIRDELESLCILVLEPAIHRQLTELRAHNEQHGQALIEEMRRTLSEHNRLLIARTEMSLEHKTWDQLRAQFELSSAAVTGLSYVSVAFVTENVTGCYSVLGELHQLWKREILSFQDFINSPQLNGYRGIHTTVILEDGTRVRCKMRDPAMHEYARKGVVAVCFSGKSDITEFLPWTRRLSPMSADTEGHSQDFWQSLQNDILGNAITIHGPDNATVQLPQGSSVLDGAFYLLQEKALKTTSISMNGISVSFGTPLTNAAVLQVTATNRQTVDREWLRWIQTGYAAAIIRSALMQHSEEERITAGREMLQDVMTKRRRGFLAEFDEVTFEERLQTIGYPSLKKAYLAIADGRVEAKDIYQLLFERLKRKASARLPASVIRYQANMDSVETMDRLNMVHRLHGNALQDIRYRRHESENASIILHVKMSSDDLNILEQELTRAGAEHIAIVRQGSAAFFLFAGIILLWGLDPVVARYVLSSTALTATDLTVIRFGTCFAASAVTYLLHQRFSRFKPRRIHPFKFSLIASAAALFITALFTYTALQTIPATQYILVIVAGVVATELVGRLLTGSAVRTIFVSLLLLAATVAGMTELQPSSLLGLLAATGAALGFSAYTEFSRRFLETGARIHARYPAFVFWLSCFAAIVAIAALPFTHGLTHVGWRTMAAAIGFSFIFTFLPYALYFECMRIANTATLTRLLPLVIIAAIVGESIATLSIVPLLTLLPLSLFFGLYTWGKHRRL